MGFKPHNYRKVRTRIKILHPTDTVSWLTVIPPHFLQHKVFGVYTHCHEKGRNGRKEDSNQYQSCLE